MAAILRWKIRWVLILSVFALIRGARADERVPVKTDETDPVLRAVAPAWVEILECEPPAGPTPAGAPAEILLSDNQDRLTPEGSDYYRRLVIRLLNAEGVRQNAEWSVVFAPEYETVTWHTMQITRGGVVQDRLATAKFKKLQRELGFETQILDGQATALTILDDVRVGDVLEVAYSTHNANPLLRGHLSATHYLGSGYPIRRQRVVVRSPLNLPDPFCTVYLPPGTRNLPDALYRLASVRLALESEEVGDERLHRWEGSKIPAVVFDQYIPAQASPFYPMLRVTSFRSWAEVAAWGEALFATSGQLPESALALVEQWKRDYKAPLERMQAAVRWVQDDVRYFAMAVGEHNLRPRPLIDVCATRFGDCKDKALLLSALLRQLDIEAWPALVNSRLEGQIVDLGPTPFAFDHAIVAYRFNGQLRWLDATYKNQQGPPGEWAVPPYARALILDKDTEGLTAVQPPVSAAPDTETRDVLTIDPATGAAVLKTQVTLRALQADIYRQRLEATTPAELSTRWFNFISRFYKRLEEIEAPVTTDDQPANEITVQASYRIPEFARIEGGVRTFSVYAYALRALLDPPESRRRHWPYALPGDRFVRHRIEVDSPEPLALDQQPELIVAEGLDYRAEKGLTGKRFIAVHDLRVTKNFVAADKMDGFCEAVDDLLTGLGTVLRVPVPKAPSGSTLTESKSSPVPSAAATP